jgi:hypothetical protein
MKGKIIRYISPEDLRIPDDMLQLNGQNIPIVNNVTYLGVTFHRRMTWRDHIKGLYPRPYACTNEAFLYSKVSVSVQILNLPVTNH